MAKNTSKLTAEQREDRKAMKAELKAVGGAMFTYPEKGIVVVVMPALPNRMDSKYVRFTVAQCSESDNFRAKVGQFIALGRWYIDDVAMSRKAETGGNGFEIDLQSEADTIAWFFGE